MSYVSFSRCSSVVLRSPGLTVSPVFLSPLRVLCLLGCPATRQPGDHCAPEQFECVSDRSCIPASYQCDEELDCPDHSDEYGCSKSAIYAMHRVSSLRGRNQVRRQVWMLAIKTALVVFFFFTAPPSVTSTPEEAVQAARGSTVTFTCQAVGVPMPIISWRLNWGHIPTSAR